MNSLSDLKAKAGLFVFRYKFRLAFVVGTLAWTTLLRIFVLFMSPLVQALLIGSFGVLFFGFSIAFSQLITAPITFSINTYLYDRKHAVEETEMPELLEISTAIGSPYQKKIRLTDNPKVESAYTNMLTRQITIPRSWKDKYTFEQLLSIIGHEVAHLKTTKQSYLDMAGVMLGVSIVTLAFGTVLPTIFAEVGGLATFYLLLIPALQRNEYRADEESAKILGSEHLIEVLKDFDSDPSFSSGSETHPSPKKRIKRLRKLSRPDAENDEN
ncbi:MAG: M48 family metalloprotease [Nitrososphaerales archaeon]|jgi:Zn-dependent protease with chaperone function